ncbi:PREDICTED: uncharacterized protein LOC105112847, partial [Populus euphratica]|uniref:Uncharacterized protein LOC105112847 n=1 Tax=Populus euphratica TaxID=75702 RepID=A0AAJ6T9Z0_POPEU
MASYEALYGRRCRTLVCWEEVGDRQLIGLELVQITSKKIKIISNRMKAAQERQKSYANNRRRLLEFEIGDKVFLKVTPWKQVLRFGMKGKLAPRYVGSFEVTKRIEPVAYRLALPLYLAKIHDVFHVSLLRKAEVDTSQVLPQIPLEIDENLTLEIKPVKVLDYNVKELRNKKIPIIKILWRNSQIEE